MMPRASHSLMAAIAAADIKNRARSTATECRVTMAELPPSANQLFDAYKRQDQSGKWVHQRSMTKVYKAWHGTAVDHIRKVQRPPMVCGEVEIWYSFGRNSPLADLDNFIKPTSDALVAARVIENDRYVQALHACWADVSGVVVVVRRV